MSNDDYGKFPDGRLVTDADVQRWADEAKAGFPDTEFGPIRRGPGRPPVSHPRVQRLQVRVDDATMAAVEQRARERGKTRSDYLLELVQDDLRKSA